MPPKPHERESDIFYSEFNADVAKFVEQYGVTEAEAARILLYPLQVIHQLAQGRDADLTYDEALSWFERVAY